MRILVSVSIAICASQAMARGGKVWSVPTCSTIKGIPSVGYTTDDLATMTDNNVAAGFALGSFAVVAFEPPGLLLAEYGGTIFRSRDGGCRWSTYATLPGDSPLKMVRGAGTRGYGFSFIPRRSFYRIDASANPRNRLKVSEKGAPWEVVAVAADPLVPDHVRMAGQNGQIYESFDGGELWGPVGVSAFPPGVNSFVYFAAFDPADPNHVVFGFGLEGVRVTTDGGQTWTTASGLSATGGQRNAFSGAISPADSNVVYVMSLDLDESAAGVPSGGRHIYRSDDGGLSFTPVVDQGPGLTLTNGPLIVAHPTDPDVVYSSFGARVGQPGVWLYRYDHFTGTVTINQDNRYFGLRAIEFNPADPSVLYLGLEG
jgi:photosystem II stability/assembly factor-like uncharacterized protein